MLRLEHISKTFAPGTVNEKPALQDLSLHLEKGEFATIVGSNGAGKSTLFNVIAGSFLVDEGSVTLAGQDVTFLPEHQRAKHMGRLFQDPMGGTAPGMTIGENLALAAGRGGWHGGGGEGGGADVSRPDLSGAAAGHVRAVADMSDGARRSGSRFSSAKFRRETTYL